MYLPFPASARIPSLYSTSKSTKANLPDQQSPVKSDEQLGPSGGVVFRNLFPYIWPSAMSLFGDRKRRILLSIGLLLLGKILNVHVPVLFKALLDNLSAGSDAPPLQTDSILSLLVSSSGSILLGSHAVTLLVLAAKLGANVFSELRNIVFSRVTQGVVREMHRDVFEKVLNESLHTGQSISVTARSGTLTRTLDRGTRALQFLTASLVFNLLPTALELSLVAYLLASHFGWVYASISVGSIAAYSVITFSLTAWRGRFRKAMNEAENSASNRVLDSLLNRESVKANQKERFESAKYDSHLGAYESAAIKNASSLALLNMSQSAAFSVAITCMLGLGISALSGNVSLGLVRGVGDLVMMHGLLFQLAIPLNFLGTVYRETKQSIVDLTGIFALLRAKTPEGGGIVSEASCDMSSIFLRDVSLKRYSSGREKLILSGVTLEIPKGRRVALVGVSGSGKSSLIRLVSGLVSPTSGFFSRPEGPCICWLSQETNLFHDSLLYNITYGMEDGPYSLLDGIPSSSYEHAVTAMKMANLGHFLGKESLERMVGERGISLSGGERQRVLLARVFARALSSDRITALVLDEPTGSLDAHSEDLIFDSLFSFTKTIIVVTHSVRKIAGYVDQIVVLKDGAISQLGSHDVLFEDLRGDYRMLWEKDGKEDKSQHV